MAARVTRATNKDRTTPTQLAQTTRADASQPQPDSGGDAVPTAPPVLTLADIQQSIMLSSSTVCAKLDALSQEITAINTKLSNLEDSVSMNSDKLSKIEQKKLPEIEKKIDDEISKLQDKLTLMEIYGRRTNLLFYGVKESANEHAESTLRETFAYLGIDANEAANIALVNVHRLPRRDNAEPSQASGGPPRDPTPRAIIAKFVYMRDRNRILDAFDERQRHRQPRASTAAPGQEERRITVRTDLPPALKAQRSTLAKTAYDLRRQKHVSTKIYVAGTKVLLKWKEKGSSAWNLYRD